MGVESAMDARLRDCLFGWTRRAPAAQIAGLINDLIILGNPGGVWESLLPRERHFS
jgi:hypothetical protein